MDLFSYKVARSPWPRRGSEELKLVIVPQGYLGTVLELECAVATHWREADAEPQGPQNLHFYMNHSRFCSGGPTIPLWEAHGSHFEKFMASLWALVHSVNQQVTGRGIFDFCPQDVMFRGLDCLSLMQWMSLQGAMSPQLCILQDTRLFLFILSKSPSVASIMDSKKWGLGRR